ncbi:MAG: hypothetical protein WCH34_09125 [Bacteroidota bacterium]
MAIHQPWLHSHNTFESVTHRNFTLGDKIITNHEAGLVAEALNDPSVGARVTKFRLVSVPFHTEFVLHIQCVNELASASKTVNNIFHSLGTTDSNKWARHIEDVYEKGSVGYKRLLQKGRKVLYSGTFTNRLAYLDALELALSTEAAPLDATYDEVHAFIPGLKTAFQNQKNAKDNLRTSSAHLEPKRVACMNAMFSDLGFFIEKYPASPKDIERTFDLTSIRHFKLEASINANEYVVDILAGHQEEGGFALTPNMKLLFTNLTPQPVKIFLSGSNDPNQEIPEAFYLLGAEASEELFISQIGNPNLRYMYLLNESSTENAQVSIMILN